MNGGKIFFCLRALPLENSWYQNTMASQDDNILFEIYYNLWTWFYVFVFIILLILFSYISYLSFSVL